MAGPSNRDQAGTREERGHASPLPGRGCSCTGSEAGCGIRARIPGQDAGSAPRSGPIASGAIAAPQAPPGLARLPARAYRACAPAKGAASASNRSRPLLPSLPPSLPGSGISGIPLWDSVPAGPAPRRRGGAGLGEGSAKEEREAGEAKVAVRAGPRPESPPGGGGRGAARGAAGEPGVRGHRRGWRRGSGTG